MKNRLRLRVMVGTLSVLLVAGVAADAQTIPQHASSAPNVGAAYASPVVLSAHGQPMPASIQDAGAVLPVSTEPIIRGQNGGGRPAFRVTMAADETAAAPRAVAVPNPNDDLVPESDFGSYKACGHTGCCVCSPYKFRVYGEFLYLRTRDSEVCYAVETNSNLAPPPGSSTPGVPIQISPIGMVDQDYSAGFRFGFGIGLDECSELGASYTWFDTSSEDWITRNPNNPMSQITPMVLHPATFSAITGTVEASARHDLRLDVVDIDYRSYLVQSCTSTLDYVLGVRYGRLDQAFSARFSDDLSQLPDAANAATNIDFNGIGLKLGLEAERFYTTVPLKLYAKGTTSLLAGEFEATYQQTVQNNSNYGVNTGWEAGRIVPTFDLEIGGGFYLPEGRLQATIGYVFSAWTNVVKTEDWIHGVQTNDFRDMGDTITFDGLVARVEGRF